MKGILGGLDKVQVKSVLNRETEGLKVDGETDVCIRRVRFLKGTVHVNLSGHQAKELHVQYTLVLFQPLCMGQQIIKISPIYI